MKIKSYRYSILQNTEEIGGSKFEIFDVLRETLYFGFSFFGEILNREPFDDIRDANKLIEEKCRKTK